MIDQRKGKESPLLNHDLPNAETRPKRYSRLEKMEAVLAKTRLSIREAAKKNRSSIPSIVVEQDHSHNYVPHGPIYRNANAFYRYVVRSFIQ